jgi:hypothetical protein
MEVRREKEIVILSAKALTADPYGIERIPER